MKIGERIIEAAIRAKTAGLVAKGDTIDVYLGEGEHREFRDHELSAHDFVKRAPEDRFVRTVVTNDFIEWNGFRIFHVVAKSHFGVGVVGIA